MSPAMDQALAQIERDARHAAFHTVKQRARRYRSHRLEMGALDPDLPFARPRLLIALGEHLIDFNRKPARWPVNVSLVNARAVALLGRWDRRFGAREREAA